MADRLKKILMLTLRADFGGGQEHVYKLLKSLSGDFEFHIACPKEYPYYDRYKEIVGEERIIILPHRKFRLDHFFGLYEYAKAQDINLIHSHGKGAGIYSRPLSVLSGIKCVHTFHGLHIGEYNSPGKALYIILERIFSKFTSRIITVSKSEYDRLLHHKIAAISKLVIIENGVKIPDNVINSDNNSRSPINILTITRNDYAKNPKLLFSIMKSLKNMGLAGKIRLNVIGIKKDETDITSDFEKAGLSDKVDFIGTIPTPSDYILSAFCYLSTSRWEGSPLGLMEAMSYGLPAVVTNVHGNNDLVVHNECGFLYNDTAPEEAALCIKLLLEDTDLWKRMSDAARTRIINNFSIVTMAEKTKQIYNMLLNR